MYIITTEEVMNKLDMFQCRFGKIDEFGWWDLEIISTDAGFHFTSTEFQDECQTRGVHLELAAPEHQEMNVQVKMTWRKFCTISHSLMVHARVLEACIHFALIYTVNHIFLILPIKDPINKDDKPTTPFKLVTGKKPSITFTRVILSICCTKSYCTCWDKGIKYTSSRVKWFPRYLRWNSTTSKRYLVYVPHRWNIISPYNVVFDEIFSSVLEYMSQPYTEAMDMRPDVS